MAAPPSTSTHLRDRIAERMAELGMSPTDLEQATGLSGVGLANIRKGQRRKYQVRLTRPLCEALGWTADSIERLLAGEEPQPVSEVVPAGISAKLDEMFRLLESLESNVLMIAAAVLPVDQVDPTPASGSGRRSPSKR